MDNPEEQIAIAHDSLVTEEIAVQPTNISPLKDHGSQQKTLDNDENQMGSETGNAESTSGQNDMTENGSETVTAESANGQNDSTENGSETVNAKSANGQNEQTENTAADTDNDTASNKAVENGNLVASQGGNGQTVEPPRKRRRHNPDSEHDTSSEEEEEAAPSSEMPSGVNYTVENGTYAYTDPSGQKLIWDAAASSWVPAAAGNSNYVFDGETYLYKDDSGSAFKFSQIESKWEQVDDEVYEMAVAAQTKKEAPVHGATYQDPDDGTIFEWDAERSAWFPKIDDDFMAKYQMSYGVNEAEKLEEGVEKKEDKEKVEKLVEDPQKKVPKPPTWFEVEDAHNTKVYVTGLPTDMTEDQFVALMGKYGFVAKELNSSKWKVRMYKDEDGNFKGDALCDYLKVESVELALQILDGSVVDGKTVHVERAKFQMKGEYDPTKKPKRRKKKDLEKAKKKQEKLFEWRPEALRGERQKHESVVVIKRLFKPEDIENKPELLLKLQELLRRECGKYGTVRKVEVHDRNPEGIAQVYFKDAEDADQCIMYMHGRWLNESKVAVETWDGTTKYRIKETEEEKTERLAKWNKFLEKNEAEAP